MEIGWDGFRSRRSSPPWDATTTPRWSPALASANTTARDAIVDLMAGFDVEASLVDAGVTSADLAALRARFVGSA
jgi:hypothetical protein